MIQSKASAENFNNGRNETREKMQSANKNKKGLVEKAIHAKNFTIASSGRTESAETEIV